MNNAIADTVGQASMCWDPIPTGVFEATRACKIAEELEHLMPKYLRVKTKLLEVRILMLPIVANEVTNGIDGFPTYMVINLDTGNRLDLAAGAVWKDIASRLSANWRKIRDGDNIDMEVDNA